MNRTNYHHIGGVDGSMKSRIDNLGQLTHDQREKIQREVRTESIKPLSVVVMGQTGVGKSSLLNSLFCTNLTVGDFKPTTTEPEPITVQGSTGHPLIFWDMPGIGESEQADDRYLALYREKLIESDVVLWAIHADTRSTLLDSNALRAILSDSPLDEQRTLMAKLTFVLTKADLLTPSPWIFVRDGETGVFTPSRGIRVLLDKKAEFFQDVFIKPYGGLGSAWTYPGDGFRIDDSSFDYDDQYVVYRGFMSEDKRNEYAAAH
ncbi:MAG: GTPase family protein, partial [Pseudonocardiales bacterium]